MYYTVYCSVCRKWQKHNAEQKKNYFLTLTCTKCKEVTPYVVFPSGKCIDARLYDFLSKTLMSPDKEDMEALLYGGR